MVSRPSQVEHLFSLAVKQILYRREIKNLPIYS